jgi:hypothetical protein
VPRLSQPSAHIHLKKSPLVFAGYGVVAPEHGWDDYGDMDLTGKTVILLRGDPGTARGDTSLFGASAATTYGQGASKLKEAAKRGAVAAISIFIESGAGVPWAIFKGGGLGQTQHFLAPDSSDRKEPELGAAILVTEAQARALFAAAGLSLDEQVAAAGKRGFRARQFPGSAAIDFDAEAHAFDSHNVIGVIEGSSAPEESEVLMAHWDHMGVNPALPGDKIFNGAVDNASGVATLIEIARAYKAMPRAPRRSVVFVATTAEERGLLGSEYLSRHPVKPLAKTAAGDRDRRAVPVRAVLAHEHDRVRFHRPRSAVERGGGTAWPQDPGRRRSQGGHVLPRRQLPVGEAGRAGPPLGWRCPERGFPRQQCRACGHLRLRGARLSPARPTSTMRRPGAWTASRATRASCSSSRGRSPTTRACRTGRGTRRTARSGTRGWAASASRPARARPARGPSSPGR